MSLKPSEFSSKPPLKRKTTLRSSGLKRGSQGLTRVSVRKKKTPEAKLKERLWELCRQITAKRYLDVCFTCDKPISGANRQLGHFIPRSVGGTLLRYNLDNLRWQCYYDNINLGGNGSEFYRRLVKEIGLGKTEQLFSLKNQTEKANKAWFEEKILEYQQVLASLEGGSVG